ncbi:hypothetical protein SERLA73DRAFT_75738 [Serpula lacrymans var. lacrymans S7.3]|uniref:Uncharacterized protein n=2 Tax=Serpula lacrymans var. lacrymans TaxID=341189 RepID=F8Q434_SERL3|nr:uncharacterized protein SERLADRAFT_440510 [Serpula lacrymans var. lacrymans S7.9]EGN96890.1 hypothetical protein SERLA73DRAFT_75738 [Serpula lacrymans var. lacrymans S7.3]EGO22488.1 hypothetical protein SERLADRAFT_440510 [Serpula lacrymans var. lacrymans S7.9]
MHASRASAPIARKYSNRPKLTPARELMGWDRSLSLVQHGPRFKQFRKNLYRCIGTHASTKKYTGLFERETHRSLQRLSDTPLDFEAHTRLYFQSTRNTHYDAPSFTT